MVAPIVHQNCKTCEKHFVGPYSDQSQCETCLRLGDSVIVRHLEPLPDLPPDLEYDLVWCNEEEAEFVVVSFQQKD